MPAPSGPSKAVQAAAHIPTSDASTAMVTQAATSSAPAQGPTSIAPGISAGLAGSEAVAISAPSMPPGLASIWNASPKEMSELQTMRALCSQLDATKQEQPQEEPVSSESEPAAKILSHLDL